MPIIIPSKNIYGITNDKVRNNKIDTIRAQISSVNQNNKYDSVVHAESLQAQLYSEDALEDFARASLAVSGDDSPNPSKDTIVAYTKVTEQYSEHDIEFDILLENEYISELFTGKDKEGQNKIQVSINGKTQIGTATAYVNADASNQSGIYDIKYGEITKEENGPINLEKTVENVATLDRIAPIADASISFGYKDNLGEAEASFSENKIRISLKVIAGADILVLQSEQFIYNPNVNQSAEKMSGYYKRYIPEQIELSFYGNTIGISLSDETISYGNGNKPFSVERNEIQQYSNGYLVEGSLKVESSLMIAPKVYLVTISPQKNKGFFQEGKMIYIGQVNKYRLKKQLNAENDENFVITVIGQSPLSVGQTVDCLVETTALEALLVDGIKQRYADGKETADILCSISNYFDESGVLIISDDGKTNRMSFEVGDLVVPMKFSSEKTDEPISRYKNGQKKIFEVVGVNYIYDGSVMQRITLQESLQ